jgi:hypothetical protein
MAFDHFALLALLVEHDEQEPGNPLSGSNLLQSFGARADPEGPRAWELVTRAAVQLRRLGWIDWQFMLWPQDGGKEPDLFLVDQQKIQQAQDILITEKGLAAHASRKQSEVITTQINITNSTVGQLALRDIHNVTISTVLETIEAAIDTVDATPQAKAEARSVLARLRDGATSFAGSAAGSVIEAALRQSLGFP